MIKLYKLIANCLGIGYVKGGGTIAALVCCVIWYLARAVVSLPVVAVIITILVILIGVFVSDKVEPDWGKDSSRVVIDEVAGMCISLLLIPVELKYIAAGLLLFRVFDITKPLLIRKMEALKGGWGVMMDDVLAGIYANLIMHIIVQNNLF